MRLFRKLIIMLILITGFSFSQNNILYAPEMYVELINVEPNSLHEFNLINLGISNCYYGYDFPNEVIVLCDNCGSECNDCKGGFQFDGVIADNSGEALDQDDYGFCSMGSRTATPHYGYGIYVLLNTTKHKFVYIDLRDDRYYRNWIDIGYHVDFGVRYNGLSNSFEVDPKRDYVYYDVQNDVIQIWQGNGYSIPRTEDFPNSYFENSLALYNGIEQNLQYPTIFWGKEKEAENVDEYRLYRAFNESETPPDDNDFYLINSAKTNKFYFKDIALTRPGEQLAITHYKVKSFFNGNYVDETNSMFFFRCRNRLD
ncbi:MAG: hypothetical protein K9H48_21650 [Melioribacteraceae bacterium]|nr:hypothetical protein [Melioribacteraceae bacterium]MCF8396492.1 hypothetical protein [Melioribacteraceae bacterium]